MLNLMALSEELKRVKQDGERLESDNKLLQCTIEDVLDDTVQEGIFSIKFLNRLVKKLELEYVGLARSPMQRFGS